MSDIVTYDSHGNLLKPYAPARHESLNNAAKFIFLQAQYMKCFWCDKHFKWETRTEPNRATVHEPTWEHLFPKTNGGPDNLDNVVLVHYRCNRKRKHRPLTMEEWARAKKIQEQAKWIYKNRSRIAEWD